MSHRSNVVYSILCVLERKCVTLKTAKLKFINSGYFFICSYFYFLGFLDPEKKLFSHRILSRDECIDPYSKTGNLRWELYYTKK